MAQNSLKSLERYSPQLSIHMILTFFPVKFSITATNSLNFVKTLLLFFRKYTVVNGEQSTESLNQHSRLDVTVN